MSRFTDKLCPVCREAFKESDDIVVCPDCGTPHHRDCYRSIGKCGVETYHAEGFEWSGRLPDEPEPQARQTQQLQREQSAPENADPHVAEYPSGTPRTNNPYEIYRQNAEYGKNADNDLPETDELNRIPDPYQSVYRSVRSITEDETRGADGVSGKELCYFAGRSIIHYSQAFNAFRSGVMKNGRLTPVKLFFNFCAGIFSPVHQFYRRMDILAIAILLARAIILVPSVLLFYASEKVMELSASAVSVLNVLYVVGNFADLAITILLCIFGDYLYYRHCVKRIKKIRESFDDGRAEGYYSALTESGTPSKLRVVIGCLAYLLVTEFTVRILPMLAA